MRVAVVSLVFLAACAASQAPRDEQRFARRMEGLAGLENVALVASGIYRGGQPTKEGYATLRGLGVRTIVSFRSLHSEADEARAAGLEPVSIPLVADVRGSRPPAPADLARFFSVVLDPSKQPVYVHCAFGADRTGTMCAVYRMEIDGWTPEEAFSEMEAFGFHHMWESLSEFVRGYKRTGAYGR